MSESRYGTKGMSACAAMLIGDLGLIAQKVYVLRLLQTKSFNDSMEECCADDELLWMNRWSM